MMDKESLIGFKNIANQRERNNYSGITCITCINISILVYISSSTEWQQISDDEKKDMGLSFRDNGEFW